MRPCIWVFAVFCSSCCYQFQPECQMSGQCQDGQFCTEFGTCHNRGVLGSHCRNSEECAEELACDTSVTAGECIPLDCDHDHYLTEDHRCEIKSGPGVTCAAQDQCMPPLFCNLRVEHGSCDFPAPQECQVETDCPEGQLCTLDIQPEVHYRICL